MVTGLSLLVSSPDAVGRVQGRGTVGAGLQIRRRPGRPGVTAAPTTAAFATGDGPGVTALATTAAFATGAPTTPTLPTRPGLNGMSASYRLGNLVSLDRGDDGLDGDSPVRDQLAAGATSGRRERCRPEVLVDHHAGRGARVHGRCQVRHVLRGKQLRQLGLDALELAQVVEIRELHRLDGTVVVLDEDEHVDDPD